MRWAGTVSSRCVRPRFFSLGRRWRAVVTAPRAWPIRPKARLASPGSPPAIPARSVQGCRSGHAARCLTSGPKSLPPAPYRATPAKRATPLAQLMRPSMTVPRRMPVDDAEAYVKFAPEVRGARFQRTAHLRHGARAPAVARRGAPRARQQARGEGASRSKAAHCTEDIDFAPKREIDRALVRQNSRADPPLKSGQGTAGPPDQSRAPERRALARDSRP
jgi:hypothetical protein